jgi:hypothetical protein
MEAYRKRGNSGVSIPTLYAMFNITTERADSSLFVHG